MEPSATYYALWLPDRFSERERCEHGELVPRAGHYQPCVDCPACGRGGSSGWVPALPTPRLVDALQECEQDDFVPLDVFLSLQQLAADELGEVVAPWLLPGATFPIADWRLERFVHKDVYQPFDAVFVSERFVRLFQENELTGMQFFRAPEGIAGSDGYVLYQAVTLSCAHVVPNLERCPQCDQLLIDRITQADRIASSKNRSRKVLPVDSIAEHDAFYSETHTTLVATKRFVDAMATTLGEFRLVPLTVQE